jgi:hypothetical protein
MRNDLLTGAPQFDGGTPVDRLEHSRAVRYISKRAIGNRVSPILMQQPGT